jgi:hypothetical protein
MLALRLLDHFTDDWLKLEQLHLRIPLLTNSATNC